MKCWLVAAAMLLLTVTAGRGHSQPDTAVAASNPLEFNIPTIKRGKQLFAVHCVRCHGTDGRGDTEMREFLKTPPADLSDQQRIYGTSDAAVFDVIRAGRTARDMPAFAEELSDEETWQIVSYMEYLGGRRP